MANSKKLVDEPYVVENSSTSLSDSKSIEIGANTDSLVIFAEGSIDSNASGYAKVKLRTSYDDSNYDTEDFTSFDVPVTNGSGSLVQKAFTNSDIDKVAFLKAIVENTDSTYYVDNVVVRAGYKSN